MGSFPTSQPYTYTAIADYVFDQVLTFTNMNIFLGNVDQLGSAFQVEHNYASGDGTHGRITKDSNLVINPTGRRGNAFWWGDGGAVDPDPGYANSPVWTENIWTNTLAQGPYWVISGPSASTQGDLSEKITTTNGVDLVLSCEISLTGRTGGSVKADILCYDNAGNLLSTICSIVVSANVSFSKYEATGTTPASTNYIRVRKWIDNLTATNTAIRKIKIEQDSIATTYSDESSMPQYLSARYTTNAGQSIADSAVFAIVIYEDKDWDDPGSDRYNTGTGVFTADRFMCLKVSARIEYEQESPSQWGSGDTASLRLVSTGTPTVAELDGIMVDAATPNNWSPKLNGSTLVKLDKGDTLQIETRQQGTGGNRPLDTATGANHLSIEEI